VAEVSIVVIMVGVLLVFGGGKRSGKWLLGYKDDV
jgi:hypothetical protein